MPRAPKPANMRQRRNKTTTAATLIESSPLTEGVPDLPERLGPRGGKRTWHPAVIAWWEDIWTSPMASEYTQADVHQLVMLADLIDQYWRKPMVTLATEIRMRSQNFGLTPLDRRRLQWEIQRGEEAEGKRRNPKQPERGDSSDDPRAALRVVN